MAFPNVLPTLPSTIRRRMSKSVSLPDIDVSTKKREDMKVH